MWSAGCIFFEMLTGSALFTGDKEISVLRNIMSLLGRPAWSQSEGIPAAESLKQCGSCVRKRHAYIACCRQCPHVPEWRGLVARVRVLSISPGGRSTCWWQILWFQSCRRACCSAYAALPVIWLLYLHTFRATSSSRPPSTACLLFCTNPLGDATGPASSLACAAATPSSPTTWSR